MMQTAILNAGPDKTRCIILTIIWFIALAFYITEYFYRKYKNNKDD